MRYALTPEGVGEILRRATAYFRRAARNTEQYRTQIESFVVEVVRKGAVSLVLVGSSELDFLIEFVCERHGLPFVKTADLGRARAIGKRSAVVLLLAESEASSSIPGAVLLQDLLNRGRSDPEVGT